MTTDFEGIHYSVMVRRFLSLDAVEQQLRWVRAMVAAKWLAAWCVLASVLSIGPGSASAQYNFRNNGIQSDRPKWERGGIGSDYDWRGSRNRGGGNFGNGNGFTGVPIIVPGYVGPGFAGPGYVGPGGYYSGYGYGGVGYSGFGAYYGTPGYFGNSTARFNGWPSPRATFSAGDFSANRYGRVISGVSRGGRGALHYSAFCGGWYTPYWGVTDTFYGSWYVPTRTVYVNGSMSLVPTGPAVYVLPIDSYYGCVGVLPSYGFASPVWPGQGFVPSVVGIDMLMSASMVEAVLPAPSTATYTIVPPSVRMSPAPRVTDLELNTVPLTEDDLQIPRTVSAIPIINEFPPTEVEQKQTSLAEKIQSLRYQASGDDAFRKGEYSSAEVFYQAAIDSAPTRRAPWLRLSIARVAEGKFSEASSSLKAGLLIAEESTRVWITAEELYGSNAVERSRAHAGELWNWLAEEPLSTDRLLLSGFFQKHRGYDGTADELLEMASHNGPEAAYVTALQQIAGSDVQRTAKVPEPPAPGDGIIMRGPAEELPPLEIPTENE